MAQFRHLLTMMLVAVCLGIALGHPKGRGRVPRFGSPDGEDRRGGRGRGPSSGSSDEDEPRGHRKSPSSGSSDEEHPTERRHKDMRRFLCKLENSTDTLMNKSCGCGEEADLGVTCSLGPITVTKDDVTYQSTFCDITPDWAREDPWVGVLRAACKISAGDVTYKEESCGTYNGTEIECSVGPASVDVNGTTAEVLFCQRPDDEDEDEDTEGMDESSSSKSGGRHGRRRNESDDSADEDEDEDDEACVQLQPRKGGDRHGKGKGSGRGRPSHGRPGHGRGGRGRPGRG